MFLRSIVTKGFNRTMPSLTTLNQEQDTTDLNMKFLCTIYFRNT